MVCKQTCKTVCIVAYILASLGAIVAGYNAVRTEKQVKLPKALTIVYALGGIVTLICALRWAFNKEGTSLTV
jgi:hypothetical protein